MLCSILNQRRSAGYAESDIFSGVDLYHESSIPYPPTRGPDAEGNGYDYADPVTTGRTKLHSVALSDTIGMADDRVLLTLGARRQSLETLSYSYGASMLYQSNHRAALSPVGGLVVRINDQLSFFANSIQGLSQGPQAPANARNANEVFAPCRSRQIETGLKYDYGSFGSTLSLFQIKQPSGVLDGRTQISGMAGEERNCGVEWTMYGEPLAGLKRLAGSSFIRAALSRTEDATDHGNIAVGVPKWQYNTSVDDPLPFVQGLGVNLGLTRTGGQYANTANTLHIPAWTCVDLGGHYATKLDGHPLTWRLMVLNLANRSYWASALGGYLTQAAPRTIKFSMSMRFASALSRLGAG